MIRIFYFGMINNQTKYFFNFKFKFNSILNHQKAIVIKCVGRIITINSTKKTLIYSCNVSVASEESAFDTSVHLQWSIKSTHHGNNGHLVTERARVSATSSSVEDQRRRWTCLVDSTCCTPVDTHNCCE